MDAGEIGDVVLVKSLTPRPQRPPGVDVRHQEEQRSPCRGEQPRHRLGALVRGSEIDEVYAIGGNFRCPQAGEKYPDFYDNVAMVCRFENGKQGFIDGAVSVGYGYDARMEIVGTSGVMFVGRREQDFVVTAPPQRASSSPS